MTVKKFFSYTAVYPILIVLAIVGYFLGGYGLEQAQQRDEDAQKTVISDIGYYNMPRMNLTLSPSEGGESGHVRIDLALEVEKKNMGRLDSFRPRIADRLVTYVRQQDISTLRETDTRRDFREGLLREANKASYPVPIIDIVFRQMVFL